MRQLFLCAFAGFLAPILAQTTANNVSFSVPVLNTTPARCNVLASTLPAWQVVVAAVRRHLRRHCGHHLRPPPPHHQVPSNKAIEQNETNVS